MKLAFDDEIAIPFIISYISLFLRLVKFLKDCIVFAMFFKRIRVCLLAIINASVIVPLNHCGLVVVAVNKWRVFTEGHKQLAVLHVRRARTLIAVTQSWCMNTLCFAHKRTARGRSLSSGTASPLRRTASLV